MAETVGKETEVTDEGEMSGPRIEGKRVRVSDIAVRYRRGESPEEIAERFPGLELSEVHSALSYYHSHREEVEKEIDRREHKFEKYS
ncbi:MAG: DUF433 domain-containing protein [Candidatus Nanohaloarchaea archaeon]